jgi:hypothetical protein
MSVHKDKIHGWLRFMAFNTTFNNILALSWRSVLLMEKTKAPGENHRHASTHRQIVSRAPRHLPD